MIAVSDAFGAVHNENGLDIKALRRHIADGDLLTCFKQASKKFRTPESLRESPRVESRKEVPAKGKVRLQTSCRWMLPHILPLDGLARSQARPNHRSSGGAQNLYRPMVPMNACRCAWLYFDLILHAHGPSGQIGLGNFRGYWYEISCQQDLNG